jgi:hypothetical protein
MAHNEEDVLKLFFILELQATSYHSAVAAAARAALDNEFTARGVAPP